MATTLCLTLAACGTTSNNAALTSLGNQLDETANTISNIQTVNPTDLNISKSTLDNIATKNGAVYNNALQAQQSLLSEEYYKTDILNKTAKIKNNLSQDLKLSKAQTSAVKDLTGSLMKYTNSVAYSQSEMSSSIKSIVSMKKNVDKNMEKINAKLNRLACNSNARSSFYENILNTLNQLDNCLTSNYVEPQNNQDIKENENQQTQQTKTTTENKKGLKKNIDSYITYPERDYTNPTNSNENNCNYCENGTQNLQNTNPSNCPNNSTNCNENYATNRYNRFNNTRNTDTYGPTIRNIDTYGGYGIENGINNGYAYGNGMYNGMYGNSPYGNGMNGFNREFYNSNNFNRMTNPMIEQSVTLANSNIPEKRLEDFEKVNEDNTVEKIEQPIKNESENAKEKEIEKVVVLKDKICKKESCKTVNGENKIVENQTENKTQKTAQSKELDTKNNQTKESGETNQTKKNQNENNANIFKSPKIRIVDLRKEKVQTHEDLGRPIIGHQNSETSSASKDSNFKTQKSENAEIVKSENQ